MALRSASQNQRERGGENKIGKVEKEQRVSCGASGHKMFLQLPSTVKSSLNFPKSQVPLHHNPKCPSFPSHQTILPKKPSSSISLASSINKPKSLLPSTVVRAKPKKSRVASLGLETRFTNGQPFQFNSRVSRAEKIIRGCTTQVSIGVSVKRIVFRGYLKVFLSINFVVWVILSWGWWSAREKTGSRRRNALTEDLVAEEDEARSAPRVGSL